MPSWQAPVAKEEIKSLAEVLLHGEITPQVPAKDARVRRAMQHVAEAERLLSKAQQETLPHVGLTASYDPQNGNWIVGLNVCHSEAYSQLDVLALEGELIALQQAMKEQQRARGLLSPIIAQALMNDPAILLADICR